MATIVTQPSKKLMKALGLPEYTTEFSVSFKLNHVATVECKYHLHGDMDSIEEAFTQYTLSRNTNTREYEFNTGESVRILGKRRDGCRYGCSMRWTSLSANKRSIGDVAVITNSTKCSKCGQKLYSIDDKVNLWHPQDLERIIITENSSERPTRRMDT